MKLLTAEEVKSKGRLERDTQAEIIRKNNEEAASSARRLNEAKEREAVEMTAIENRLSEARLQAETTINDLASHVRELEKRREEALRPTRDRELAVEKREIEVIRRNKALNDAFIEVEEGRTKFRETIEQYEARYAALQNWEISLSQKEESLKKERAELDVYTRNSRQLLKKEQDRLRIYFEVEDAKLNLKRKQHV